MAYKLIALDVDGTIRTAGSPIAERTRSAVDAVRRAGAIVTLATGRTFGSATQTCGILGIEVPIATSQGAYIANPVSANPVSKKPLLHRTLTTDMALAALDALQDHTSDDGTQAVAYHSERIYVDRMSEWAAGYGQRTEMDVVLVDDLREVADERLTRIVAVGKDHDIEILEREVMPELSNRMLVTRSLPYFCEILHPQGGKEDALAWMCDRFGIRQSETVAFGNGYNDIQMLEWVNLGIAVGDAVPEALAAADIIAPAFAEHGVAQVLEDLLRDGKIG